MAAESIMLMRIEPKEVYPVVFASGAFECEAISACSVLLRLQLGSP